jgi:hypothetical protein
MDITRFMMGDIDLGRKHRAYTLSINEGVFKGRSIEGTRAWSRAEEERGGDAGASALMANPLRQRRRPWSILAHANVIIVSPSTVGATI